MAHYRLEKRDLGAFIENLSGQMEVIAPVKTPAGHVFKPISNPQQADLSYGNTAYSTKRFFLPSMQPLLEYPLEGKKSFESLVPKSASRRIILGARQCELHAINENDEFFLSRKPADPYYKAMRENTLIAVLQCKKAANEYCFCTSLGFDSVPDNHDLLMQDEGDHYVVSAGSIAGDEIISRAKLPKFGGAVSKPDIRCGTVLVKGAIEALGKAFSDPIWDATANRCISCGACTLACPTCWCFDTQDQAELGMKKAARMREWDSCQFLEFGRIGGDFCFRRPRGSRVRHRVFHKFQYSIERFGKPTCVGCGRCLPICLTKINHVEIMNKLAEKYK
ncbi:MAG: 4Fe-4S dicluster domain-containing protein [Candidatus Micrarchaeia archaeon]